MTIQPARTMLARILAMPTRCLVALASALLPMALAGCGGTAPPSVVPSPQASGGMARPETSPPKVVSVETKTETPKSVTPDPTKARRLSSFPRFTDVAGSVGVDFTYRNGATGKVLMVEATGGGAGWLDYDRDGLLDLYLCQGGDPASANADIEPSDGLFRQSTGGVGNTVDVARHFLPRTNDAFVVERGYSQGVSVGDFDDDGFDDVYVTNVGANTLFRNLGDGTFQDATRDAGVAGTLWSSSAAWGDLDGDGDLDLYVCNYVDYDPRHPIPCGTKEKPGTCHPMHVEAVPDDCFFNQGDGTFTEESRSRGLFGPGNKALGVVIARLTEDELPDVYVANDTTANFLFVNQGKGVFKEMAYDLGCAVNRDGHAQASMGVGLGDYDRNGRLDLYCTHFTKESNTLYRNLGETGFQDATGLVGLHTPTLDYLAFGTIMEDFNQDGHDDIFVANGHVDDWREKGDLLDMPAQLFSFEGPRFVECTATAGDYFRRKVIGRGVARGDYDGDGDWDLAVVHQNAPMAVLRNDSDRGHWLKVRCIAAGNRRGVGTRVVARRGGESWTRELAGGTSYAAAHEAALLFGFGADGSDVALEIHWPDGRRETISDVTIDRELILRQPPGTPVTSG